ncbi:MAG: hypothetical protein ACRC1H_07345, partial [Caldilineaceae bacterium]
PTLTPTITPTQLLAPMGEAGGAALAGELGGTPPAPTLDGAAPDTTAAGDPNAGTVAQAPSPTPTSLYEVITATPLPAMNGAGVAPAVTPWPTATPSGSLLAGFLSPTAQNLTVMLLCFIFLSASVLGGLGLITSVLWMRSRSQRDLDELRWRARLDRERRRLL